MKKKKKRAFAKKDGTVVTSGVRKWKPSIIVDIYKHARAGLGDIKIAKRLGVTYTTLKIWKRGKEEVKQAIAKGKADLELDKLRETKMEEARAAEIAALKEKELTDKDDIKNFVFTRLPPHLQAVWRRIEIAAQAGTDENGNGPNNYQEVQRLSKFNRQHLFLFALVNSDYNFSEAAAKCGFCPNTIDNWKKDPDFAELLNMVQKHKGDFFESKLVELVRAGDPKAIIHVNKTFNRNRGYGNEVKVSVTGTVTHDHKVTRITDLDLDLETRIAIRDSYRRAREGKEETALALPAKQVRRDDHELDDSVEDAELVGGDSDELDD